MSTTNPFSPLKKANTQNHTNTNTNTDARPTQSLDAQASAAHLPHEDQDAPSSSKTQSRRRKGHRGGKKKRPRRKSFAPLPADSHVDDESSAALNAARESLYGLQRSYSETSLDNEALFNHRFVSKSSAADQGGTSPDDDCPRDQPQPRRRGSSSVNQPSTLRPPYSQRNSRRRLSQVDTAERDSSPWDERTPLMSTPSHNKRDDSVYGGSAFTSSQYNRRSSDDSARTRPKSVFNVNYPPSMPGTPPLGPTLGGLDMSFGDVMIRDELARQEESPSRLSLEHDDDKSDDDHSLSSPGRRARRSTVAIEAEDDVCFPTGGLSEVAEEEGEDDYSTTRDRPSRGSRYRRSRRQPWPDLSVLDSWSRYEKEQEASRNVKRITEPHLINGRLRAVNKSWYRSEEEAPYRFTYFNEELQSTIHSQSISGLVQAGGSFSELFIPEPRVRSDDESDGEDLWEGEQDDLNPFTKQLRRPRDDASEDMSSSPAPIPTARGISEALAGASDRASTGRNSAASGHFSSQQEREREAKLKSPTPLSAQRSSIGHGTTGALSPASYAADRPVWWLDVLRPTEAEMKVLSKTFGIHPLTAEDIILQEAREKVELFRNYYFVNYRTFDQDVSGGKYMEPVDMYAVVFREGIITFHFSMTPHAANVRRRIRQLKDYLIVSSDWISYAIIDDITDSFGPIIQGIEEEVDDIDDDILNSWGDKKKGPRDEEKAADDGATEMSGENILRRVGDCRKRVMMLYRLLGNKADVIRGFAKRCNETWSVTPRSDIGIYLGDIQDHIVTMTSGLAHYEKILSRAHGTYLALINAKMTERSEQTADSLNKLTVLGTIVLPMNIITGLWGMNVWVPGQDAEEDLTWFVCITAGLIAFGFACYWTARRVYNII